MSVLKKILVYGGFLSFLLSILLTCLGMGTASIIACFLFAPGYFIMMNEIDRSHNRHNFQQEKQKL